MQNLVSHHFSLNTSRTSSQAPSYASIGLAKKWLTHSLTYLPTGVRCRATSVAKNPFEIFKVENIAFWETKTGYVWKGWWIAFIAPLLLSAINDIKGFESHGIFTCLNGYVKTERKTARHHYLVVCNSTNMNAVILFLVHELNDARKMCNQHDIERKKVLQWALVKYAP